MSESFIDFEVVELVLKLAEEDKSVGYVFVLIGCRELEMPDETRCHGGYFQHRVTYSWKDIFLIFTSYLLSNIIPFRYSIFL